MDNTNIDDKVKKDSIWEYKQKTAKPKISEAHITDSSKPKPVELPPYNDETVRRYQTGCAVDDGKGGYVFKQPSPSEFDTHSTSV
jgi:hypothetical protein